MSRNSLNVTEMSMTIGQERLVTIVMTNDMRMFGQFCELL